MFWSLIFRFSTICSCSFRPNHHGWDAVQRGAIAWCHPSLRHRRCSGSGEVPLGDLYPARLASPFGVCSNAAVDASRTGPPKNSMSYIHAAIRRADSCALHCEASTASSAPASFAVAVPLYFGHAFEPRVSARRTSWSMRMSHQQLQKRFKRSVCDRCDPSPGRRRMQTFGQ